MPTERPSARVYQTTGSVLTAWIAAASLTLSAPARAAEAAQEGVADAPARSASTANAEGPANRPPLQSWLKWGGASLLAGGTALGAVAGVISLSATSSARSACMGNQCPPVTWDDLRGARTSAVISDMGFAVAGVGLVALAASFFLWPKVADSPRASSLSIVPSVGLGSASISGTF